MGFRNQPAHLARHLRLCLLVSVLLSARPGLALRRRHRPYQHRSPRLRFQNSWPVTTGDRLASAAPPADDSFHYFHEDVAHRGRRIHSFDGSLRLWHRGNLPPHARRLVPRTVSRSHRASRGLVCHGCLCRQSESHLYAVDCHGRVDLPRSLHLGRTLFPRSDPRKSPVSDQVRPMPRRCLPDSLRRMVPRRSPSRNRSARLFARRTLVPSPQALLN